MSSTTTTPAYDINHNHNHLYPTSFYAPTPSPYVQQFQAQPLPTESILLARLKAQVEYYFSPANLERDTFLQSLLPNVPITTICNFPKVRQLFTLNLPSGGQADPLYLEQALADSEVVHCHGQFISPNQSSKTIVIHNYQGTKQQLQDLYTNAVSIQQHLPNCDNADVNQANDTATQNNTWHVIFTSLDEANMALDVKQPDGTSIHPQLLKTKNHAPPPSQRISPVSPNSYTPGPVPVPYAYAPPQSMGHHYPYYLPPNTGPYPSPMMVYPHQPPPVPMHSYTVPQQHLHTQPQPYEVQQQSQPFYNTNQNNYHNRKKKPYNPKYSNGAAPKFNNGYNKYHNNNTSSNPNNYNNTSSITNTINIKPGHISPPGTPSSSASRRSRRRQRRTSPNKSSSSSSSSGGSLFTEEAFPALADSATNNKGAGAGAGGSPSSNNNEGGGIGLGKYAQALLKTKVGATSPTKASSPDMPATTPAGPPDKRTEKSAETGKPKKPINQMMKQLAIADGIDGW